MRIALFKRIQVLAAIKSCVRNNLKKKWYLANVMLHLYIITQLSTISIMNHSIKVTELVFPAGAM